MKRRPSHPSHGNASPSHRTPRLPPLAVAALIVLGLLLHSMARAESLQPRQDTPPRYALKASLMAVPAASESGPYRLRGQPLPAASARPQQASNLTLKSILSPSVGGTCPPGEAIFADGFESGPN